MLLAPILLLLSPIPFVLCVLIWPSVFDSEEKRLTFTGLGIIFLTLFLPCFTIEDEKTIIPIVEMLPFVTKIRDTIDLGILFQNITSCYRTLEGESFYEKISSLYFCKQKITLEIIEQFSTSENITKPRDQGFREVILIFAYQCLLCGSLLFGTSRDYGLYLHSLGVFIINITYLTTGTLWHKELGFWTGVLGYVFCCETVVQKESKTRPNRARKETRTRPNMARKEKRTRTTHGKISLA